MSTINTTITNGISLGGVSYPSPLTITTTGYVDANSGNAVSASTAGVTLINDGRIHGISAGNVSGVTLAAGGTVTNASTGTISGGTGLQATGGALTLTNYGSITGLASTSEGVLVNNGGRISNATSGLITGYVGVYIQHYAAATLTNAGRIIGGTVNGAAGILGSISGQITNLAGGTISGRYGIETNRDALTVNIVNAGTITGLNDGIDLFAAGTVTALSGGVISGPTAVQFRYNYTNRLAIQPGATFTGYVNGGNPVTHGVVSTLELMSGSSTGTLNGLGATYQNFGAVTLDAGAQWKIIGTYSVGEFGSSTITGFSYGDTIDVTDFAASSASFAGNKLTLTSGGSHITMDVAGTFSSNQFHLASNGTSGTDITLSAPSTYWIGGSADWRTAADWSTGTIPGTTASATIANAGSNTVTINSAESIEVASLTLTNHNTLLVKGTFAPTGYVGISGAVLSVSGGTFIDSGVLNDAGTIIGGVTLNASTVSATIATTGSVSNNHTASAIYAGNAGTVTNQGQISVTAANANAIGYYGIYMAGGGTAINNGTITGNNQAAIRLGFGGAVTNTGLASAGRAGVSDDGDISINNSGTITGALNGVFARNGNATISNTGSIYGNNGIWVLAGTGTITNSGKVVGGATYGISLSSGGTITNQAGGLIQGTYYAEKGAIEIGGAAYTATAQGLVVNAGTIIDSIRFYAGNLLAQTVINSGSIEGTLGTAVAFSGGNDTLQFQASTSAFIEGLVDGGGGTNTLEFQSGAVTGTLTGSNADFTNFSKATIDSGATWVFAGTDTFGTNVTLTGLGRAVIAGTVTNDGSMVDTPPLTITGTFINAGHVTASGTAGTGMRMQDGSALTNTTGATITAGQDAVTTAGTISIDNQGVLQGGSLEGRYGIHATGTARITNGASGNSAAHITGFYGVSVNGAATVANFGTIAGGGGGVGVSAGSVSIINYTGGLIDASSYFGLGGIAVYLQHAGAGSVQNFGSIDGLKLGVDLGTGETLVNGGSTATTARISSDDGTGVYAQVSATVTNYGTITGGTSNIAASGVALAGGTLSNFGVVASTYLGVNFSGTAILLNSGSITGGSVGVDLAAGGLVNNGGTIRGTGTAADGVDVFGAATVVDTGLIASASRNAIALSATGASVTVGSGGVVTGSRGVYLFSGGTVVNAGTISGTAGAVVFHAGSTGRLVIDPGAVFSGAVNGGNTIGATSISTLELASGASTGTLNGFGGQYVNFAQITLDAGSQWDIKGTDATTALAGATISGFTYGDTIDVTNFAATTASFAANHLTLTSGGSTITLDLPGTFTIAQLRISSDGGTGTDIALVPSSTIISTTLTTGVNLGAFYVSPLTVTTTGYVHVSTSTYGAAIYAGTSNPTLTNDGRIIGNGTLDGVLTGNVGVATIDNLGTIQGGKYGVAFGTPGSLTNSGTIIGGTVGVFNVLTLDNVSPGTIGGYQYGVQTALGTLTNNGTIQVTGTHATAIYLSGGGANGTVINNGLMSASYEVALFRGSGSLNNSGTMTSTGRFGVRFGASGSVTNSGTISATNAIEFLADGTVSNTGTGLITGLAALGIVGTGSVFNAATIDATDGTGIFLNVGGAISNAAGGVVIGSNYHAVYVKSGAATVVNFGTMVGKIGIGFYSSASAGTLSQTVIDSGTIAGTGGTAIAFSGGDDTLQFEASTSAFIQGLVDGGGGTNTLEFLSGATAGTLTGNGADFVNFDRATVDAGAAWVFAGSNTFGSSVTLTESGSVTIAGTVVNDGSIALGPTDLSLAAGGYLNNEAIGRITGISGHGTGVLAPAILGLAGGASTVVNLGTVSDSQFNFGVRLLAGGTITNGSTSVTTAQIYARVPIYITGAGGTVSNFGTLRSNPTPGGTGGITLGDGGVVRNGAAGSTAALISGAYNGIVVNGAVATVTNFGTIDATAGKGILLQAGGTVIDSGTIVGGGGTAVLFTGTAADRVVLGPGYAITGQVVASASASSTLELASAATAGTLSGLGIKFVSFDATTIDAGANWTLSGANTVGSGVTLTNSGTLVDAGTLVNVGGITSTGVAIGATGGALLTNLSSGTIIGLIGVSASGAATLRNAGYLGGSATAVALHAGTTNRLVIDPGATFVGTVNGGNTIGATSISTLELASAASIGTLTGLGIQFIDFAALTIDAGADWELSGSNTLLAGVTLTDNGSLSVAGTFTNRGSIVVDPPITVTGTFINSSIVSAPGTYTAFYIASGGLVSNATSGTITGQVGITGSGTASVVNAGSIGGGTGTAGYGIRMTGGVVTNQSGGIITGSRAVYFVSGTSAGTVANAGIITGGTTGGEGAGIGVALNAGGTLSNSAGGVISGGVAVIDTGFATVTNAGTIGTTTTYGIGVGLFSGGLLTNQSGGTIKGAYGVYAKGGTITNRSGGVINGGTDAVTLAAGATNRLVIDPGAVFIGTVNGGNTIGAASVSTLELASGASIGTLNGVGGQYVNFAQITLDNGAQWDIKGTDATTALAGATISGFTYGDTIDVTNFAASAVGFTSNHLTLTSGASHVTIDLPGSFSSGQFRIASDGTSGTDIELQSGPEILNYGTTIEEVGILAAFETVDAGGTLTLFNSGSTAIGTIDVGTTLSTGDFLLTTANGNTYVILNTVFGTYTSGVTLLTNPSTIAATAKVSASIASGNAVYGAAGTTWTLVNLGSVTETASGAAGIRFGGAASLTNGSSGTITAYTGVYVNGTGTVLNTGAITGNLTNGNAAAVVLNHGGYVSNASGGVITGYEAIGAANTATVVNSGRITGNTASSAGTGIGISTGAVTNLSGGTITGHHALYAHGLVTVTNAGSIGGTATGVQLARGGTIVNASGGIISGGTYAVKLAAGYTELLVIDPGATFTGVVTGGNGAGGSASSTLELASGAGTGTLTSLASSFQSFGTYVVDAGASWALSGGNTIEPGYTLTNNGTLTILGTLSVYGTVLDAGTILNDIMLAAPDGVVSVSSTGQILAGGTGNAAIYGVHGGTVINTGLISNTSASGAGVSLNGGGSVNNGGTITAASGVLITGGAGTVTDGGTIIGTGGTAVSFGAGNDMLRFDTGAGAKIQGIVDGGAGTNTLEFLSAAVVGTLTGVGADFINFTTGTVDAGARWVLAGSNTFGSGLTLTDSGTLTVAGSLANAASIVVGPPIYVSGTLVNSNTISAPTYVAISLGAAGTISNTTSGLITADAQGVLGGGTAALVSNLGTIQSSTQAGVALASGGTVINGSTLVTTALIGGGVDVGSGLVSNYGSIIGSGAIGAGLATGQVINQSSGLITDRLGIDLTGTAATATNFGRVSATVVGLVASANGDVLFNGTSSGSNAVAVGTSIAGAELYAGTGSRSETLVNYGTLSGKYGAANVASGAAVTLNATIIDAGTIIGTGGTAIATYQFSGAHSNLLLQLRTGNDFIQGTVVGEGNGTGRLEFTSGASTGTLTGSNADFINFQTAGIDAGASWVLAGTNTFGSTVSFTDAGTLTNTGSLVVDPPITVTGTFINSSIVSAPGTYTAIYIADGGVVSNTTGGTIIGGNNAITAGGTVGVTNLGTIDGVSLNGAVLLAGAIVNGASGTTAALLEGAKSGARLTSGSVNNYGTIRGTSVQGVYIKNHANVVNSGTAAVITGGTNGVNIGYGTITNNGTISGTSASGSNGIYVYGRGVVSNVGTGALIAGGKFGIDAAFGSVTNSGTIAATQGTGYAAGVRFFQTTGSVGVVSNLGTAARITGPQYGVLGTYGTVSNYGTIVASDGSIAAAGVRLFNQATISNHGTGAVIAGGGFGIRIARGTVANEGTIAATNTSASVGVYVFGYQGTVTFGRGTVSNLGTSALIEGGSFGVEIGYGSVANYGTIAATQAGTRASGVWFFNTTNTVAGTVSNLGAAALIEGNIGVSFSAGGTVTDSGTIQGTGGTAIAFSGGNGLLVLEHGYKLQGSVIGAATASNTLELLGTSSANAVTVTYNSLGLTHFGTVEFAPTATNYATLKISNNATLPGTITNFTGAYDTIDLTALAFVSGSSVANFNTSTDKLVVDNGTNSVTLQLGSGSYSGIGFTAVSDGATGTDIIIGASALTYRWVGGSADWRTATNWSSGIIPGTTASATIANAGSNTVTISSAESIGVAGVTLSNNNTLDVAGTLALTGSVSIASALLSVAAGGLIAGAGTGTLIGGSGSVTNDGTIAGGNHATVVSAGVVLNRGSISSTANLGAGVYAATVTNFGTISDTGTLGFAVFSSDMVVNGSSGATSALVTGVHDGIVVNATGNGTVINYGTVIGGNFVGVSLDALSGGTLSVRNAGTIISGGGTSAYAVVALEDFGGRSTLDNTGLIEGTAGNPYGIAFRSNGSLINSGTVSSQGTAFVSGFAATVTNSGTLIGSEGVALIGTLNQTLFDSGTIVGTGGTAIAFSGGNDLLQFQSSNSAFIQGIVNGGTGTSTLEFTSGATAGTLTGSNASFTNFATGTVDAGASWVVAGNVTFGIGLMLADNAGIALAAAGTLVNTGSITSDLTGYSIRGGGTAALLDNLGTIQAYNIGVSLQSGGTIINGASGNTTALIGANYGVYAASGLISNYGTISASGSGSESVLLGHTGQVSNHAGGLITGANIGVDLSGGVATLTNLGVVSATNNGVLALYDGDLVTNGTSALISGNRAVVMAAGVTTSVSDTLKNYGTITGQYGVIAGVLPTTGTLHATIVDAGTIIGTGGTAIAALATSASASVDLTLRFLAGNDFIQGTVAGEANGTGVLDFVSGVTAGTLTGSGADFINFQTASVDAGANWTLAGTNTLGANTTLVDAGTLTNAGSLVVDPPLTVTGTFINSSIVSAPGTYTAIYIANGGVVTNTSTGTITAGSGVVITGSGTVSIANFGTIANTGTARDGINLAAGTIINGASNATSALIRGGNEGIFVQSGAGTVVNFASITSGANNAIYLFQGGFVSNASSGTIAAHNTGVVLNAAGTVINQGYITGDNSGVFTSNDATIVNQGTILGAGNNGVITGSNVSVNNQGTIIGAADYGVLIIGSGSVTNSGVITGDGQVGVDVLGSGLVANYGTITSLIRPGVEIRGGTVIDAGTISGVGEAVKFYGTNSNLLVLEKGYALTGGVYGSASASNTLELLGTSVANAVTATYNTLGLTNVSTVAFAPTATNYATLKITNDATLPGTITNFVGQNETIDLTGFVSTGVGLPVFNTVTHRLTITNSTTSVSLQLGSGNYTGVGWVATDDGHGGTDITAIAATGPSILTLGTTEGVANQNTIAPLGNVTILDTTSGDTVTATVTLSSTANGALSNFGSGTYNSSTGVYSFTGSASAATAALQALIFTPIAPASGVYVTATGFTVAASGTGGSSPPTTITLAAVQQVLGLTSVPVGNIVFSVSTDGSSFATATGGKTNEAVVTAPTNGDSYALPSGYQAEFIGGSANVLLTDNTVANAILVGNSGNDTIGAGGASNVSIVGGNGANTIFGGTGQIAIVAGSGNNLLSIPRTATATVTLGNGNDTVYADGAGTINGGTGHNLFDFESVAGANVINARGTDTVVAAGSLTTASISGGSSLLEGGAAGTVNATLTGAADTVVGGGDTVNVTASGGTGLFFGGSGSLSLTDQGSADTIVGTNGAVTVSAATVSPLIYAGSGSLVLTGGTGTPTVVGGAGTASIAAGSGGVLFAGGGGTATVSGAATLFGSAGGVIDYIGSVGGALFAAQGGSETIDASQSSTSNLMYGGSSSITGQVFIGGTGTDTIVAGAGSVTVEAHGTDFIDGGSGTLRFIGGSQSSTVLGGAGGGSISAGSGGATFVQGGGTATLDGAMTAFGASGGVLTYIGSVGGVTYNAGGGAETINASLSGTNNVMWASGSSSSSDLLVGGGGNDTLFAGPGSDTLTGGAGNNVFVFLNGRGGGTAQVTDFATQDVVDLFGYGSAAAATALNNAVSSGGNTTLTLSDNTRITFLGVSSASVLQGHVFSA